MKLKLTYFFLIVIAIIAGYLLGNYCATLSEPILQWFGKSFSFCLDPTAIHLTAFTITFGISLVVNPLEILFVLIAIVAAPKVAAAIK